MPLAKVFAVSLIGLAGAIIEVEADISSNLPGFTIVGLPDAALNESTARVRAACSNSGLPLPGRRITINLSPAAIPKFGSGFDLAIAVVALKAAGTLTASDDYIYLGELGPDGSVRPVPGVLPSIIAGKNAGFSNYVVPLSNLAEAKLVSDVTVIGVNHLAQVATLHGAGLESPLPDQTLVPVACQSGSNDMDISDVLGQREAIEALIVAAAGGHHLLMVGSPGVGKTMLAQRMAGLLPDLALEDALETTAVHSIARGRGTVGSNLITRPPFESPHHTASTSSLTGGGLGIASPGLISLAHNGVLFLDEAPEFQQPALESLRQSLESGQVQIARSAGVAKFPARFQLVLAANPCPCGNAMNPKVQCTCGTAARQRYLNKFSGPLMDRVDIRLRIRSANAAQVALDRKSVDRPTTAQARQRIIEARSIAVSRNAPFGVKLNAHLPPTALRQLVADPEVTSLLDTALVRGILTMRGYDRCLRLALTIADLDAESVGQSHISRAVLLRGDQEMVAL